MIEAGVKKENMVLMAPLVMPWGVMSSYITGRLIGRATPLAIFRAGWTARLVMVFLWMGKGSTQRLIVVTGLQASSRSHGTSMCLIQKSTKG